MVVTPYRSSGSPSHSSIIRTSRTPSPPLIEQHPHELWFINRNSLCDSANYTNCYHGYRSSENAQRLLQLLSPTRPHRLGRSLCCLSSSLRLSGRQARPRVRTLQAAWESDVGNGSSRMCSTAVTNARSACLDGMDPQRTRVLEHVGFRLAKVRSVGGQRTSHRRCASQRVFGVDTVASR